MESFWSDSYSWLGGEENPKRMWLWGTAIVSCVPHWIANIVFLWIDITHSPQWLMKYKVQQPTKHEWSRLGEALLCVLFNEFVVSAPVVLLFYHLMQWRGCSFGPELPTISRVVLEMFVFLWVEEAVFYYMHRIAHHPKLYKKIHEIHHEWTAPIGLVSLYSHPIEHVVCNILPTALGPLLCGSHVAIAWVWYSMALLSTTIAHSGYHFPFLPSPEFHDYHHLKFNQNYGALGVLDRLHGTDKLFRKTKAYDRHYFMLSLVPVKEHFPDDV